MRFGSPFRRRPRDARRVAEAETVVQEGPPVVEEEEVVPPPPRPRPPLLWPSLLLLLLLVAGGLVAWWLLSRDDGNEKRSPAAVVVPNVIGQPQSQAVARVDREGLVARVVTKPSSDVPAGRVFAEEPGAGSRVARKSVVTLSVSAANVVVVPNVVGKRAPAATAELRAQGLTLDTSSVASSKPRGTVLSQSPEAGAKVAKGSTVVIRVSRGMVTVPDVVGETRATAVAAIRAAGLVPQVFTVPSTQPKGTVVAQSPKAGARVQGGSKVRLNVSNGQAPGVAPPPPPPPPPAGGTKPATVTVPDVTGQAQEAAQRQLNSAGLKAGVVYVPSDQPQGTVVSQAPQSGTTQKRGTRIQLNVSLGPDPAEQRVVPDVRGKGPAPAKAKLQSAGFKVQTLTQGVTDASQVGTVVDEQPAGGRRAPVGSTVTIYVGRRA
jgi:beta-lactam-binding protein with PASTA domain